VYDAFELKKCPLWLGSPLKVPTTAWRRWGIEWRDQKEFHCLVSKSEQLYAQEWEGSDQARLDDVARAAQCAGIADANASLNRAVGTALAELLCRARGELAVIDIGAGTGATTEAVLEHVPLLEDSGVFSLVDPSLGSLHLAGQRPKLARLLEERRITFHCMKDLEISSRLCRQFDVAVANAALHHHAFLEPVFEIVFQLLKPGGILVIGDWHNSMWLDPWRVLRFLDSLQWEGKDEALARLASRFPVSTTQEHDPSLARANEQICSFWHAYTRVKEPKTTPCEILEGHRPPEDYHRLVSHSGLVLVGRERRLMDDSALLCVHVARKAP